MRRRSSRRPRRITAPITRNTRKRKLRCRRSRSNFEDAKTNVMRRVEVEYREAVNRETMLKSAVTETKAEFDNLNARSFQYESLKREADADKRLYEELTTKIKEAEINAGFQNSAIRIADTARPAIKAVFPNIKINLALAFLFSMLIGVSAALIANVLDRTVRDPEQVMRTLNTQVVGSLPVVKEIRAINGSALITAKAEGRIRHHRIRRSRPHAAQLDSIGRFRPAAAHADDHQRFALGRQIDHRHEPGHRARAAGPQDAADRRRFAAPQRAPAARSAEHRRAFRPADRPATALAGSLDPRRSRAQFGCVAGGTAIEARLRPDWHRAWRRFWNRRAKTTT